jgi:hypothetical protein
MAVKQVSDGAAREVFGGFRVQLHRNQGFGDVGLHEDVTWEQMKAKTFVR